MTIRRLSPYLFSIIAVFQFAACDGKKPVSADASAILAPIDTIHLRGHAATFVFSDEFVEEQEAWINYKHDDAFKAWFLGKTEPPMTGTDLRASKLLVPVTSSSPILAELGDKAEVSLAQVFAVLEYQPNGEKDGVLLANMYGANIFYVKDVGGTLRGLDVRWLGNAWHFFAFSVENQGKFFFEDQVTLTFYEWRIFSRRS